MAQERLKSVIKGSKDKILGIGLTSISRLFSSGESKARHLTNVDVPAFEHPPAVQWQSPLLTLPREIRDMIWRELLGGMLLHLWMEESEPDRLQGALCRASDVACRLKCRDWLEKPGVEQWPKIGVMGCLTSCLQMYAEGARYLYELNSFDTRSVEVVNHLSCSFPSERYNAIRSLTLCWTLPEAPSLPTAARELCKQAAFDEAMEQTKGHQRQWIQAWKSLAEMRSLEILRVELNIVGREDGWGVWDGQWTVADLDIVKVVEQPHRFTLMTSDQVVKRLRDRIKAPNLTIIGPSDEEMPIGVDLDTLEHR
ncbi:uncharacterized protein L3040_004029 [Drepanopeziza brunnea f. sp. 'multigermtubi']|uniref:uncharacterized protein n=1 Tax=Drepanopeziza brunnea f. sp. 'multigermtubi' TaxID=698441 RepID=UPI00239AC632|nr:hypothetical protein L3040_004029 [Drepanopeziza brunnea f. sp. 'multigermtubi']